MTEETTRRIINDMKQTRVRSDSRRYVVRVHYLDRPAKELGSFETEAQARAEAEEVMRRERISAAIGRMFASAVTKAEVVPCRK